MFSLIKNVFAFCLFTLMCSTIVAQTQDPIIMKKIQFVNINSNEIITEIVELIKKGLKQNGDFGVYGNLSAGIEEILKENSMRVSENKNSLMFLSIQIVRKVTTFPLLLINRILKLMILL